MYTCIPGSVVYTVSRRPDSRSYSEPAFFSSCPPFRQKQWSSPGFPPPSITIACSHGRPSRKSKGVFSTARRSPVGIYT